MDNKQNATNISDLDTASIDSMSFVPISEEIDQLFQQSIKANKMILTNTRSNLLSKFAFQPFSITSSLCPKSLNPSDTILSKLGRKFGAIKDPKYELLTVINDKNMPFTVSNGPNGVLIDCQNEKYGPNRINLFYESREKTLKLLTDYLQMRNAYFKTIFNMLVKKMKASIDDDFKIDPSKSETFLLTSDYENVYSMFEAILPSVKNAGDCGISVVSYCQTWLRNGEIVGDAQFSVMSPHFQNRFYVSEDQKLIDCLRLSQSEQKVERMVDSYKEIIAFFTRNMGEEYGNVKGNVKGQAFINLDKLYDTLQPRR